MHVRDALPVVVVLTLAAGAGVAGADNRLIEAVKRGDEATARQLLQQAVDVNVPEADGTTALHWAVRADDLELTRLLLEAGADVGARNRYGVAPLLLAATNGSDAAIAALLRAGGDPNTATPEGETALMLAARTGRVPAAEALLARGADVEAREHWLGETALMWAAAEDHRDMVRLLVEHGADPDAKSTELEFPDVGFDAALMWKAALPRGGLSPLMLAARQGALDAVRGLEEAGANLDLTDPDGTSALVIAIINAHYDVAAYLLEHGADPNLVDSAGMGALYAAVDMQDQEPRFNRPRPKPTGRLGSAELVQALLEHGADPNARLSGPLLMRGQDAGDRFLGKGATPLMRAAKPSDAGLMRLLRDGGADPTLTLENGTTLLMVAAARTAPNVGPEEATLEVLKLCLSWPGADLTAANASGQTALHLAVGHGDRVVRFLVEHGASLDARDEFGRTPLDIALGVPGKGRGGGPAQPGPVYESTAALLRQFARGETGRSGPSAERAIPED